MSAERTPEEELGIRVEELKSQVRLLNLQIDQGETPVGTYRTALGRLINDTSWSQALMEMVDDNQITPEIALRLWDLKDSKNRELTQRAQE